MDDEKMELPKETIGSVAATRTKFAKLYASMNAEQIAKIMEPIREFTKIINTPLNMNITEAASSMAKELVNIKKVIPASYSFNSLNSLSTAMRDFLNSYQTTIFNDISAISEVLKSLSDHYSEEEIADIKSKLEILATKGWVVYFQDSNFSYDVEAEDFEEVEEFWFEMLENDIADEKTIFKLEKSQFIPAVLIQAMIQSYQSENYYAAYTMATIIIDGVMNRVSEKNYSKDNYVPVGRSTVGILSKKFVEKSLLDTGLLKWLYLFFENTNKFTLNWPNRHMVNHGRWAGEISKKEFLKIFNTVLYIDEAVNNRISYV
ncbi:hypothetical protein [Streptococcus intermedius]|uniref:hypothetical protein n=1 Tax=Streptococcus intermedius TaxID=1338 RepID=UPI0021AE1CAA|nr:hypothetical protein [Streptococcus intermedius]